MMEAIPVFRCNRTWGAWRNLYKCGKTPASPFFVSWTNGWGNTTTNGIILCDECAAKHRANGDIVEAAE